VLVLVALLAWFDDVDEEIRPRAEDDNDNDEDDSDCDDEGEWDECDRWVGFCSERRMARLGLWGIT
jgi:hypothetical protein